MHALGIEPLTVCHLEQGREYVTANLCRTGLAGHTKAITAAGNFDIEAAFYLPQVLIELAAEIGQTSIVGGLENYVPRNLDSIQDLYSKPLRRKRPVWMTGSAPCRVNRTA